jgi:deoxyribonuclease-4
MLPGIHVSAAGGLVKALERADSLSLSAAQIFTSSQTRWKGRVIEERESSEFLSRRNIPFISHASYLINLSSDRMEVIEKSVIALHEELGRMNAFGIELLVMHPGAHMGRGEKVGMEQIAANISRVLEDSPGSSRILLENTAGMGSCLGWRFEQLCSILDMISIPDRTGVCIDTAHAFAAGYDFATPDAVERTLGELDEVIGFDRVHAFHINDSKTLLGSRVDRHQSVGKGEIGLEGLRHLVNCSSLIDVPAIVETPGSDEDRKSDIDHLFYRG